MGKFVLKSTTNFDKMKLGDSLDESDFSVHSPDGKFLQFEFQEGGSSKKVTVKPGLFRIGSDPNGSFILEETSMVNDSILEDFTYTKEVENKIEQFFQNLSVYKDIGIEVPKRGMLLYGPPGTGKTCIINKISTKYLKDKETTVIIWPTDKYRACDVKSFLKRCDFSKTQKLIFIIEDIGGMEYEDSSNPSDSSFLSILDNQEKIFTIPTLILGTTNYPQTFMENITNRPQRFDDKIEVGFPNFEFRLKLLQFFAKSELDEDAKKILQSEKCKALSASHLKEIVVRSRIYSKSITESINEIVQEIEKYKKGFKERHSLGL